MGIKLDWEVESDGGWDEIGEDPGAIAGRRRRLRAIRNILLALLVLFALGAGAIGYRLRQIAGQRRADLEALIAAETAALRIGDRRAFLAAQADVGEWVHIQDSTYAQYQALGPRVDVTGHVVTLDINGDHARADLREVLDGQPWLVTWFYRHDEQGWLHVPPDATFWGEQTTDDTTHVEYIYYEQDSDLAEMLKTRLDNWWQTACRATACDGWPPAIRLHIEPDPLVQVGWAAYDAHTLLVPSPHLTRRPEDGTIDPALTETLAANVALYWAETLLAGPPEPHSEAAWLQNELAVWLKGQLVPETASPSFLDPLADNYGPPFIHDFAADIRSGTPAIPALVSLTGIPAADLPLTWDSYITHRLQAEAALIAQGHPTEAATLYRDPQRSDQDAPSDYPTETAALPDTLQVVSTRRVDDILWAEVRFARSGDAGPRPETTYHLAFEPFRLVDDRWVHSTPVPADWGEALQSQSEHFILHAYTLDEPACEDLLPYLEQIYARVAADFDLADTSTPIEVFIAPPTADAQPPLAVTVLSPYAAVRPAEETPQYYVRATATRGLIEHITTQQLQPLAPDHPAAVAFVWWELEQVGLATDPIPQTAVEAQNPDDPPWPTGEIDFLAPPPPHTVADYRSAYALLTALTAAYGPEIMPRLMTNLPLSTDVDDWLLRSARITFEDIRENWQSAYTALPDE